jgi:hypothetical protein
VIFGKSHRLFQDKIRRTNRPSGQRFDLVAGDCVAIVNSSFVPKSRHRTNLIPSSNPPSLAFADIAAPTSPLPMTRPEVSKHPGSGPHGEILRCGMLCRRKLSTGHLPGCTMSQGPNLYHSFAIKVNTSQTVHLSTPTRPTPASMPHQYRLLPCEVEDVGCIRRVCSGPQSTPYFQYLTGSR